MPKYDNNYIENLDKIIKEIKTQYKNSYWTIEAVHSMPNDARKSAFKFGYLFGVFNSVLKLNNIDFNLVYPHIWKKYLAINKKYFYHKSYEDEKEYEFDKKFKKQFAIMRLKNYISESDFKKYIYYKKHHNRADAILIAIYGILNYLKNYMNF